MLAEAPTIDEQADILHFLVLCYGPKHKLHVTKLDQVRGFHGIFITEQESLMNQFHEFFFKSGN